MRVMQRQMALFALGLFCLTACESPSVTQNKAKVGSSVLPEKIATYNSAKDGLIKAQILANKWAEDSQLVKVTAQWVDPNGRSFNWIYTFYSALQKKRFLVDKTQAGEAKGEALQAIDLKSWHIDSDQALRLIRAQGTKNSHYAMSLNDTLLWTIESGRRPILINAKTGEQL